MQEELLTELMAEAPYQPATNYWRAVEIEEVIRYGLPGGRGLDLGCGDGHLMAIILRHAGQRDLAGVDIDPKETSLAARRNIYREIVTAAGDRIGFPDSHFQFVISNSVLEHIANIEQTLAEVARVLRTEGRFIFTVPGPDFHACLRGPRSGSSEEYFREVDARCAHLRYWNPDQWAAHLCDAGLHLVHHHAYLTRAQTVRWEQIARYTSGILYSLARRKSQPIEIQRGLGIRSTRFRLPKPLAAAIAAAISAGVHADASSAACLLMEARKQ